MLSYQVTYKSVSLIICVALRISLRRHALAHRVLHAAAAVKQKLDTNTEEGAHLAASLPFLSLPLCEALAEDGGSSALRVIILDPGRHGSGWALSPPSRAQS